MYQRNIWWFDDCDPEAIADFRRDAVLALDLADEASAGDAQRSAVTADAPETRFEQDMSVGDLVIVGDRAHDRLLFGEIASMAARQSVDLRRTSRRVFWRCELPFDECTQALIDAAHAAPRLSPLDPAWLQPVEAILAGHAANDDGQPPVFEISLAPPMVAMPQIPILFQSPYAERILRDFRWHEYLRANPDVAANCHTEGDALRHFMLQGYYERRIFDPERLRGFDAPFYRRHYPELDLRADDEAMIHYAYQGCYEGRLARAPEAWRQDMRFAEEIDRDFRASEYMRACPDVAADGDEHAAREHFFRQGYREKRIFDPSRIHGFDPGFYRERYPELGLQSDADAQIHYCYEGYYEYRLNNDVSAWLYDADLHVFQMGKVGSHTIANALQDVYPGNVVHAHWLTDVAAAYPGCRIPYSKLLIHPRERPVRIISASREIVSWTLSGLFQYHSALTMTRQTAIDQVEIRFWEQANTGLRWFDHRYFCDLDIYAHTFDHAAGHARIEHPGVELLLYRVENLSRLEDRIGAFVGLPGLRLKRENAGDDKAYAEIYAWVMRNFRLPGNLLSTLYDSPFMRFFYSDDERQRAYERWVRPG